MDVRAEHDDTAIAPLLVGDAEVLELTRLRVAALGAGQLLELVGG